MSHETNGHHSVRVHIDRKPHESPTPTTHAAVYKLGEVREGFELFREERGDHEDKFVPRDGETIHLKPDEHFYSAERRVKLVTITVNNDARKINEGRETVASIKKVGEVPLADDLEQVLNGKLAPLADDGAVNIKGGEVFVSHPKDSGSSSH